MLVGSCYEILIAKLKMWNLCHAWWPTTIKPIASAFFRNCLIVQMKMKTSCQEYEYTQFNCNSLLLQVVNFTIRQTKKNIFFLNPCSLSTNEGICDRKTAFFKSALLYEPSDTERILLKPTRAAKFKQSPYFLNRSRTSPQMCWVKYLWEITFLKRLNVHLSNSCVHDDGRKREFSSL